MPISPLEIDYTYTGLSLTPREIVAELDQHIVGQHDAKRAVAIAIRNRWRRSQLSDPLKKEVTPKNILMIGPTGVGKTEIARRLATLVNAPFIKVEATKFTEVGYVGRDVESIVRDLMDMAIKQTREYAKNKVKIRAEEAAIERILDKLVGTPRAEFANQPQPDTEQALAPAEESSARALFRKKLLAGELDDKEIEIEISSTATSFEIMGPPGMEEMVGQLQNIMENMSNKRQKPRKIKIKDARKLLAEEEAAKLVNEDDIKEQALKSVEQNGIVFIDELDKIVRRTETNTGGDVSREGVQRDLLPLVEGCTVLTKHGMIKTDHILFIASGAFHLAKPSDLIPELQGRFPIRVELKPLTTEDFERILTEPNGSLTEQYTALLDTEGFALTFSKTGIRRIAEMAFEVNEGTENIGARRLHTILERLLEELSFTASDASDKEKVIDDDYVVERLKNLVKNEDLSRSIL